ncbi:hypothetical protein JKP88DRAFT_199789 [Tribonema minus]|uniref:Ankyrin repeat protein n=1 Tax=Tribonema minus TaxID=303371 RepID=A0A835YX90_9STRA|nr:hypothetical protein JKP88DRAFT_199789 [Tribonema minus]
MSVQAVLSSISVYEWARANGCQACREYCLEDAAEMGHMDIRWWLHEVGTPWRSCTCTGAAERGDLAMLKWLHSAGCPWDSSVILDASRCQFASKKKLALEAVEWALANGCPSSDRAVAAHRSLEDAVTL